MNDENFPRTITPANLPEHRAKWIAGRDAARAAHAELAKIDRVYEAAKIEAEAANGRWQNIVAERTRLQVAINGGVGSERQLIDNVPAEIAAYQATLDSQHRSQFARQQEILAKFPRLTEAKQAEAQAELKAIKKQLAAIEKNRAAMQARIVSEAWPELNEVERGSILDVAKRVGRAVLSAFNSDNPNQSATLGTSEAVTGLHHASTSIG